MGSDPSNSVHAIEDRFGKKKAPEQGNIDVEISIETDGFIKSICVRDNGIGLDEPNLTAFNTCDSRFKKDRGGKGIGRLIWLKVFDKITVRSTFSNNKKKIDSISFEFVPDQKNTLKNFRKKSSQEDSTGTEIFFMDVKPQQNSKIRPTSFLKDLALHFFSYFITDVMPRLTVTYGDRSPSDLGTFIKERIEDPVIEKLIVDGFDPNEPLEIMHLYVQKTISRDLTNSILLIAHNRLVEDIEIEKKFALNRLPDGRAYIALVRGIFLDQRVDQERMGFKLTDEQHSALHETALESAMSFLEDHIIRIRRTQQKIVRQLLEEHPQLAIKVRNVDTYVETLSPSMDNEDIGKTLFTLLYRDERKVSNAVKELSEIEDLSEEARKKAQEMLSQVSTQAKGRLAEYVVKRRQILDLAKIFLRYTSDDGTSYHYEKTIHDLICPMGKIYSAKDYKDHNLWIIDDMLAYYSFFSSDKPIRAIAPESEEAKKPDVVFFNPLGLRREGTNDPVVLIEFKRPGDETPSRDPVDQVLEYIEKLRSKTVRDIQGEIVSEIRDGTPFQCYVICDLTEGTRRLLQRSVAAHETPDGEGYFGFAPNHRAAIHVISYKKLLRDAELRNQIFFEKLGLVT